MKLSETSWRWDGSSGGMGEPCRSSPGGLPCGPVVKNPTCQRRETWVQLTWVGKIP